MRSNFQASLAGLTLLEAGQVGQALTAQGDRGGLTGYRGITDTTWQAFLQRHGLPAAPLQTMTAAQSEQVLDEGFWTPAHCDDLPVGLDFVHFAWYVNHGPGANEQLQAAAEAWNAQGLEDGVGPITLAKIQTWDLHVLIERYLASQATLYDIIEKRDPTQIVNLHGWKNRIIRTRDIVLGRPLSC